jgi:hypothetical protein
MQIDNGVDNRLKDVSSDAEIQDRHATGNNSGTDSPSRWLRIWFSSCLAHIDIRSTSLLLICRLFLSGMRALLSCVERLLIHLCIFQPELFSNDRRNNEMRRLLVSPDMRKCDNATRLAAQTSLLLLNSIVDPDLIVTSRFVLL